MNQKEEIGLRIKQIRIVKGWTQAQYAFSIGALAVSTISAYEKGNIVPQGENLSRIAELGGVSVDDVLKGGDFFEEVIGRKAAQIKNSKRMRENNSLLTNATSGDIQMLIERLNGFQKSIEAITTKLIEQKEKIEIPVLTSDENKLLTAFRQLSPTKRKRIVEDTIEWTTAISTK